MKLLSDKIFDIVPKISGLQYIPNYIEAEHEDKLIKTIDSLPWNQDLSRRVQHYGFAYDYGGRKISSKYLGDLPDFLAELAQNLYEEAIFPEIPNQAIINEYMPGQGITAHIDSTESFGSVICSISLLAPCMMSLIDKQKIDFYLEQRSLLVLSGEARFVYKHQIAQRKYDNYLGNKIARKRRISITFRNVIK